MFKLSFREVMLFESLAVVYNVVFTVACVFGKCHLGKISTNLKTKLQTCYLNSSE